MRQRYRNPFKERLASRKSTIIAILLLLASAPTLGALLHGTISERAFDAMVPHAQLSSRLKCAFQKPETSQLPLYELLISATDFKKLTPPIQGFGQEEVRRKDFARITVRYQSFTPSVDKIADARMRLRGITQSEEGRPLNFKMAFPNESTTGYKESHLLYFGATGGEENRWWPLHMWLAEKLDLLTPRNRLVRVKFNGKLQGVYWEFEQWGEHSFERYGIKKADIFADSDELPFFVNLYLWKNTDAWKRYDSTLDPKVTQRGFVQLTQFLDLVNRADDATFNRHIFDHLDFESSLGWLVHMTAMNSFRQRGQYNARLFYDKVTGLFKPIPWNALPGMYPRQDNAGAYTIHILTVRLLNHERFQRAYSKKLQATYQELKPSMDKIFSELYLPSGIECAVLRDDFSQPFYVEEKILSGREILSFAGVKRRLWDSAWQASVDRMRHVITHPITLHQRVLTNSHLFVSRNMAQHPKASPGNPLEVFQAIVPHPAFRLLATLGHRGQAVTVLHRLVLPLTSTAHDGQKVVVQLRFQPKPLSPNYWYPLQPSNRISPAQTVRYAAVIQSGRLVLDNLDLAMMANFPKLASQPNTPGAWTPIESQDYDLFISLPEHLSVDTERFTLDAVNVATGESATIFYKAQDTHVHAARQAISHEPESLVKRYPWLAFDRTEETLTVVAQNVTLHETLVIPRDIKLVIPAGTHLKMGQGISLISYGPILAQGTTEQPILFSSNQPGQSWGNIGVLDTAEQSILTHLFLRDAGKGHFLDLNLQGIVNFHLAPVHLEAVVCEGSSGTCISIIEQKGGQYQHV